MKRLLVSMDDERYEDLRRFAFEKKVPMAELVRHAIEETFEDQLDGVAAQRGFEEHMRDPSSSIPIEELLEKLGIELPDRNAPKGRASARTVAASRSKPDHVGNQRTAPRPKAKRRQQTARKRELAHPGR